MRRLKHEDFVQQVEEKTSGTYEVLGEYVNNKTRIKMKHLDCGNVYEPLPYEFIARGTRCPVCVRKNTRTKDFKERVNKLTGGEYEVVGEYINSASNVEMKHVKCGQNFNPRAGSFLYNGTRCPFCSGRNSNKATFEKELFDLVGNEYTLVGDYVKKRR